MLRVTSRPHRDASIAVSIAVLFLLAGSGCRSADSDNGSVSRDWRSDWSVPDGYAMDVDAEGFGMPTAIAFVPEPGPDPGDPLYFVTELEGRVRVVTNDRSVRTFAEGFMARKAPTELPALEGETGLAGICLDARRGHVFVTFAHRDSAGDFRNEMIRFETGSSRFAVTPASQRSFTELFGPFRSAVSHQIGSCRVSGDAIFVSVADGRQMEESQRTGSLLGKVLRFHVDGHALSSNPFFRADSADSPAGFVWASGLRNPFGLTVVDQRVFVADNGSGVDRFLEIQPSENYLWSGRDASIAARADAVIVPSVGPAHLDYVPAAHESFSAEFQGLFLVAMSSLRRGGVLAIPYGLAERRMLEEPKAFVRYNGKAPQIVSGLAVGPDGVYFAPILPDAAGRTPIYRVRHQPERAHPFRLTDRGNPTVVMAESGCLGCHSLGGEGGAAAPTLDRAELDRRLRTRLASPEYVEQVRRVDALDQEPFITYRAARQAVLDATGRQQRELWVKYKLLEPRFDHPDSQMPHPGISDAEASLLAAHLLRPPSRDVRAAVLRLFPSDPGRKHLVAFAALGFIGAIVTMLMLGAAWYLVRARRGSAA